MSFRRTSLGLSFSLCFVALAGVGCGSSTDTSDAGVTDVPVTTDLGSADVSDAAAPTDAARTDVPVATDVPATTDVPAITDVPATTDVPAVTDVPAATDVPAVADVPATPDSGPSDAAATDAPSAATLCTSTGGTVSSQLCCGATGDFPNLCGIGACGCSPTASHTVQTCQCAGALCFDPARGCVTR